jgi:hypothetical protein
LGVTGGILGVDGKLGTDGNTGRRSVKFTVSDVVGDGVKWLRPVVGKGLEVTGRILGVDGRSGRLGVGGNTGRR